MIKNLMLRGLPALTLCTLSLFTAAPAAHSAPTDTMTRTDTRATGPAGAPAPLPLFEAIDRLAGGRAP
ncbi:hypothetical protein OG827_01005 [Streptomyces sp. NBC_00272]|nr:hypothetical protein [Streptomyces sp. NBC_00272]